MNPNINRYVKYAHTIQMIKVIITSIFKIVKIKLINNELMNNYQKNLMKSFGEKQLTRLTNII